MKHAVIVAHPRPDSLTCEIARAYADTARDLGDEVEFRDLYRMGFNPCLGPHETPGLKPPRFSQDVLEERERLAAVDVFAFVYPLWFNAPPAMLKGYVDRVFGFGFGYEPGPGGMAPLLDGRRLISFTTSGAPEAWVRDTGALSALTTLFDAHLAAVCGLRVQDHIHNGGIVPGTTAEAVDTILERVRWTAGRLIADARAAGPVPA